MKYEVKAGSRSYIVEVDREGRLTIDDENVEYDFQVSKDPNLYSLLIENESHELRITEDEDCYRALIEGENIRVEVMDERTRRLADARRQFGGISGEIALKAPMPGLIIDVLVKEGDEVEKDQPIVILESMKMHNEFRASRAATVKKVRILQGDKVLQNDPMVVME